MATVLSTYRQNEDNTHLTEATVVTFSILLLFTTIERSIFIFILNFFFGIYTETFYATYDCTLNVVYVKPCEGNHNS